MENSSAQRLAELFARCREDIMVEWRSQAAQLLRDLNLDQRTMTDHLPDIVAEIIRDLAQSREGALTEEHTRGSPPAHGVQRYHDGLEVGQVVGEYNLLRNAFATIAERHGFQIVGEAARIIHHRLDEAVRLAVTSFAAQQELMRKQQDDEHLAFIAHDLRTPLNAVALVIEEIKMGMDPKSLVEADDLFEIAARNLKRVGDLIRKVIETNVQQAETSSAFRPERRTFELWPLVQRLIIDLRVVAAKQNVEVVSNIPRSTVVFADAGLIAQVYQNLLANAFKYAAQGRVLLSAESGVGGVTCTVQDDGSGIPPAMLDKVFDKLATDPDGEGTGLGLTIVKQIISAHGGTVTAESTLGEGATFTFTLPEQSA